MEYLELCNEVEWFLADNEGKKIAAKQRFDYFASISKAISEAQNEMEKHRKRICYLQELRWEIQGLDYEGCTEF